MHGAGKMYLSKNASFASWINTLSQNFPSAQQVCCLRSPEEVIPSQLSSLHAAMQTLGNTVDTSQFKTHILNMLKSYYDAIATQTGRCGNLLLIPTANLQENLQQTIQSIYQRCGLTMSTNIAQKLSRKAQTVRHRKSKHNYTLGKFHFSPEDIASHFGSQITLVKHMMRQSTNQLSSKPW
jgi:hypothetical protein